MKYHAANRVIEDHHFHHDHFPPREKINRFEICVDKTRERNEERERESEREAPTISELLTTPDLKRDLRDSPP